MNTTTWQSRIGASAWNHICKAAPELSEKDIAAVLTAAAEVGMPVHTSEPDRQIVVSPDGHRTQWPGEPAALTATGLAAHWAALGHGWLVFHLPTLLEAVRGPLLPDLQLIWTAYELQAVTDKVPRDLLVPADYQGFVGGSALMGDGGRVVRSLVSGAPPRTAQTGVVAG